MTETIMISAIVVTCLLVGAVAFEINHRIRMDRAMRRNVDRLFPHEQA